MEVHSPGAAVGLDLCVAVVAVVREIQVPDDCSMRWHREPDVTCQSDISCHHDTLNGCLTVLTNRGTDVETTRRRCQVHRTDMAEHRMSITFSSCTHVSASRYRPSVVTHAVAVIRASV